MNILRAIAYIGLSNILLISCYDGLPHSVKMWHDTSAKNVILNNLTINGEEIKTATGYRLDKKDWSSFQPSSKKIDFSSNNEKLLIKFNLSVDGKKTMGQCNVQTEGQLCSVRITFVNTETIHCACDGMSI